MRFCAMCAPRAQRQTTFGLRCGLWQRWGRTWAGWCRIRRLCSAQCACCYGASCLICQHIW